MVATSSVEIGCGNVLGIARGRTDAEVSAGVQPSSAANRWKPRTDTTIREAEAGAIATPPSGASPSDWANSAMSSRETSARSAMPRASRKAQYRLRSRRYAAMVLVDRPRSTVTCARYASRWRASMLERPDRQRIRQEGVDEDRREDDRKVGDRVTEEAHLVQLLRAATGSAKEP